MTDYLQNGESLLESECKRLEEQTNDAYMTNKCVNHHSSLPLNSTSISIQHVFKNISSKYFRMKSKHREGLRTEMMFLSVPTVVPSFTLLFYSKNAKFFYQLVSEVCDSQWFSLPAIVSRRPNEVIANPVAI